MIKDPIVEEIHRIREKMAAEARYDVRRFFKMIQASEKRSSRKFIRHPAKRIDQVPARTS